MINNESRMPAGGLIKFLVRRLQNGDTTTFAIRRIVTLYSVLVIRMSLSFHAGVGHKSTLFGHQRIFVVDTTGNNPHNEK